MRDVLPEAVFRRLHNQYDRAVQRAVASFQDLRGDEDTLTGALGQSLRDVVKGQVRDNGRSFRWATRVKKLRGRGRGAPENLIGADAFIEIEVWDESGELIRRKSVPVQAKKEWQGSNRELAEQASKIAKLPGGGLVVDYTGDGYLAVPADVVSEAEGNRRRIDPSEFRDLANALAGDFIECRVGTVNTYFDANRQILVESTPAGVRFVQFAPDLRIRTTVQEI